MSEPETVIERERIGPVVRIRIRRPQTKNSLTVPQIGELRDAVDWAGGSDARCMLLTGVDDCFCAGRDLRAFNPDDDDTYRMLTTTVHPLLRRLRALRMPSVAAVQGPALGLGFGLALSCDIVLASETAKFGSPFRNFGGVPDSGTHYYLLRALGRAKAMDLILTGRLLDGREAASAGLINRAVPAADLESVSLDLCRGIADGPRAAFAMSKEILARERDFEETVEMEARSMDAALHGPEGREGVAAYQQRRAPRFSDQ